MPPPQDEGDSPSTAFLSQDQFPVVGVGASAGGIAALRILLELMPANTGMAFVIVLHLSPEHESTVDSVLQQVTRMPVVQVKSTLELEADHVYVISPKTELEILGNSLKVKKSRRARGPQVSVDLLLRTLAEARRDRSVAVILSGSGSDGSLGVTRVRERGGVTLAQLPEDSEYSDMPRNAILTGAIDFVLPVSEMPQKLLELWQNAQHIAMPPDIGGEPVVHGQQDNRVEAEKALHDILDLLASRSGHDFRHYKRTIVLRRIERRLQVNMLKDLLSYREFLRDTPSETPALLNDMLISVTQFFRDRAAFEALERDHIAAIYTAHSAEDQARVWVPGCATGEEAYSLTMLFAEQAIESDGTHHYQVFASDVDERALAFARAGVYPESIDADVPPARARRFFDRERGRLRIAKAIRDRVLFASHNVLRDSPFSRVDLISCRNLLIYLDRSIQERLLEVFFFALRPGGLLFLGSSESADVAHTLFEVVDKKHRIYRARRQVRNGRQIASLPLKPSEPRLSPVAFSTQTPPGVAAVDVHRRVLEHYGPPSVIVDQDCNIVHMSDKVGRFLQHAAGEPSRSLITVVKSELRPALRTALFQALHSAKSIEARRVSLQLDGQPVYVNMIARPFRDPEAGADFVLVLFHEVDDTLGAEPIGIDSFGRDEIVRKLEEELQRSKDRLQATIEQAEHTSEDLKATNEELQAINEELRSAGEELETSKEELQSVNEELITVNAELRSKADETTKVNDDLQNFVYSTAIATIFVDTHLRIRRYTPSVEAIFNIIPSDIGRSLLDLTHHLHYPALQEDATSSFENLRPGEREVRGHDGKYYVVRTLPYRTADNRIDGAVINFLDVTSLRNAEDLITVSESRLLLAATASQDFAIIVIDGAGYISAWNAGATSTFGFTAHEALGKSLNIVYAEVDISKGVLDKEIALAKQGSTKSDDRWYRTQAGERIYCSGVMTPIVSDQFHGFVKILRDATIRHASERRAVQHLRTAVAERAEVEAASALKDDFLAVMSHELKNPLNLISVSAEVLGRAPEVRGSTVAAQSLASIRRAIRGQAKIIDDLLDMSRIRTGKFTMNLAPVDFSSAVENLVEIARADATAAGIKLSLESGIAPVIVYADASRLEQIVWNLLSNAMKFTPEGGHVTLMVSAENDFATLTVEDDGHGIEIDYLPRIFELFGQAPGRALRGRAGLGIGLSLARQLVERHGGRITARSEGPGKGAAFQMWIPLYEVPTSSTTESIAPDSMKLQGCSILLVEDAQDAAAALAKLLEFEGAVVRVANNGRDALELLRAHEVDLVVSDIGMPGMDGYALATEIRKTPAWSRLPIIALTGFGRESDIAQAIHAGFTAHISKPVAIEEITSIMARFVAHSE